MKAKWLIDADLFQRYRDELVEIVHELGHTAKLIQSPKVGYRWDEEGCSYRETFRSDECVVVHGDIDLVTRVQRDDRWVPGVFAALENFLCSNYFCHFGQYLLNNDYVMLPFGELNRCRDFLFDTLGVEDRLFFRPDSPLKLFTGVTGSRTTFDDDLELMGFYEFPPSELVVVSSPKTIVAEWRFVIADGAVVAGSEYSENGTFEAKPSYDPVAYELASTIAKSDHCPDPVWVVDICKTDAGVYRLLEIGAFSFADLYATDKRAVVSAVSEIAVRCWSEVHGLR